MVDPNWALVAIAAGGALLQAGINIGARMGDARRIAELERKEEQNAEIRAAYREKVDGLADRVDDVEEEIEGRPDGIRTRLHRVEAGHIDLNRKYDNIDDRLQREGKF